jgi:hypothetical protein
MSLFSRSGPAPVTRPRSRRAGSAVPPVQQQGQHPYPELSPEERTGAMAALPEVDPAPHPTAPFDVFDVTAKFKQAILDSRPTQAFTAPQAIVAPAPEHAPDAHPGPTPIADSLARFTLPCCYCPAEWCDADAAAYGRVFARLRRTASLAGWRPDACGCWSCPDCQKADGWRAPCLPDPLGVVAPNTPGHGAAEHALITRVRAASFNAEDVAEAILEAQVAA